MFPTKRSVSFLSAFLSIFGPAPKPVPVEDPTKGISWWAGQHTASADRLHRRALVRKYGRRQALKHIKLGRRLAAL